jgi:hypothetical protein
VKRFRSRTRLTVCKATDVGSKGRRKAQGSPSLRLDGRRPTPLPTAMSQKPRRREEPNRQHYGRSTLTAGQNSCPKNGTSAIDASLPTML